MLGAAAKACENKSSTLAHARTPHSKLGVSGPIFSKSTSSCGTGSPSDVNTSMAARAPACSAPLMYPGHQVAVSVPAKAMRACEALIASPHCASTPALAVPTGQPPVNGSFAQSNSRYMRACHAPARRTRAPQAPPPPYSVGCNASGPKYSANLERTSCCRCCSVNWLAATAERPATKQMRAGETAAAARGMESS